MFIKKMRSLLHCLERSVCSSTPRLLDALFKVGCVGIALAGENLRLTNALLEEVCVHNPYQVESLSC